MRSLLACLALGWTCTSAHAQDAGLEVRVGPALHGLEFNLPSLVNPFHTGRIEDVAVELIYTPPADLSFLGSPRLALGGTFSLRGLEHMVHANLNWHVPVLDTAVYLEGGLGAAYVTGYLHNPPAGYRRLGCHQMFYFQTAVGVELPQNWTATLAWEHSSHAWLCGPDNESLNSLSLKVGHKF
jgi:lipid A 3-O-deacylase